MDEKTTLALALAGIILALFVVIAIDCTIMLILDSRYGKSIRKRGESK